MRKGWTRAGYLFAWLLEKHNPASVESPSRSTDCVPGAGSAPLDAMGRHQQQTERPRLAMRGPFFLCVCAIMKGPDPKGTQEIARGENGSFAGSTGSFNAVPSKMAISEAF